MGFGFPECGRQLVLIKFDFWSACEILKAGDSARDSRVDKKTKSTDELTENKQQYVDTDE